MLVVDVKVGVRCKSCGKEIEIDDDYFPGLRAAQMAVLYGSVPERAEPELEWQRTLTCGCGWTYTYNIDDLVVYD